MKLIFAALIVCGGLVANHLCKHPAAPECKCEAPPTAENDYDGPDLATAEPATAGKPVARGATVLARWNHGDWWEARVVRAGNAGVVVAWADGSGPSTLEAFEVAPLDRSVQPKPGDVALCKDATSTKWSRTIAPRHGECVTAH
jgi:hypothetical protein